MTRPWRNCRASMALIAEVNALWPGRDRSSDGTIGDAAHATRTSDHNPFVVVDGTGVVRARDIDKDGIPVAALAEYLRVLGARGDIRLRPGGYLIFNRRITAADFSGWRSYNGPNPHTGHLHVSFSQVAAGFDSAASWGLAAQFGRPVPPPPFPPRPRMEDDDMYVKCESAGKGSTVWTGLLSGGLLIGPLSPGETSQADSNIKAGAVVQWLERSTWDLLVNRRSAS